MKKILIFSIIILSFICIGIFSISLGKEEISYTSNDEEIQLGKVTAESLKIRSGISTENEPIGLLSKNDTVHIYAKDNDWYIIKTENNQVGAVFGKYIEIIQNSNDYINQPTVETSSNIEKAESPEDIILSQDEQVFFNLINNERIKNSLPEFKIDENLLNVARLKAKDIVENNYFSHTSPTYGTIFEMLQNNNISYNKASENIAKSMNADNAITSLMDSESHKKNILSQDFNYTGISVINCNNYGKIFVELFIAK